MESKFDLITLDMSSSDMDDENMCEIMCILVLLLLTGLSSFFSIDMLVSCNRRTIGLYEVNEESLNYIGNGKNITAYHVKLPIITNTTQHVQICYHFINPEHFEYNTASSEISFFGTFTLFCISGILLIITLFVCCMFCLKKMIRSQRVVESLPAIPMEDLSPAATGTGVQIITIDYKDHPNISIGVKEGDLKERVFVENPI